MVGKKRPTLPAPTDSSINGDNDDYSGSTITYIPENETDLSQQTEKTSYSIPEDGSPLTIPTKKISAEKTRGSARLSETSLLIEYYEGSKDEEGSQSRPSVRVKVNPHARRPSSGEEDVNIPQTSSTRRPSRVHRVSLGDGRATISENRQEKQQQEADFTTRSPSEVENMDRSELASDMDNRNVVLPSDVSSMPPDSMLDGPPKISTTEKEQSDTPKDGQSQPRKKMIKATLKAPNIERTRSKSTERITQKAIEKLQREQEDDLPRAKTSSKARPKSGGSDSVAPSERIHSKRSSRSRHNSDVRSGTESSLLPPREIESNVSNGSKISINNPKLLATVEDAIRRLILPEIETIKRNQSVRSTRTRDSFISDDSLSRSGTNQRLSQATGEPYVKGQGTRDDDYGDYVLGNASRKKKHRHSSRDSASSRQDSIDSISKEKAHSQRHRHRDSHESGLTKENLRSHDSRSSVKTEDYDRRRQRDRDRRRSDSIANTEDEYYGDRTIPPMPMTSEVQDSELTRESLLSAETMDSVDEEHATAVPQIARQVPIIREVNRASPNTVESPVSRTTIKSPSIREASSSRSGPSRDRDGKDLRPSKSDRSIGSNRKAAAFAAAGLSAAAAGLYGHDTSSDKRPTSRGKSRESSFARVERKLSSESKQSHKKSPLSKESLTSVEYPLTQKRHKGINLEKEEDVFEGRGHLQRAVDDKVEDDDRFFDKQHELNQEYRSSLGFDSQRDSADTYEWKHLSPGNSPGVASDTFSKHSVAQQLRGVGANARVVSTPKQPESAIASLIGDSNASFLSEDLPQGGLTNEKPRTSSRDEPTQPGQDLPEREPMNLHSNASAERWNAIRGHAQALSQGTLSASDSGSIRELLQHRSDNLHMSATGGPVTAAPLPDMEYFYDNESDLTDYRDANPRAPSVVEGRLGDEYENQGLWPYEPTPDIDRRRGGMVIRDDVDPSYGRSGASIGDKGAGLGIGSATAAALRSHLDEDMPQLLPRDEPASPGAYDDHPNAFQQSFLERQALENKDEGYVTGDPGRSVGGGTPLSFSKPPPKLFDENSAREYTDADVDEDPLSTPRNVKHLSANSHGLPGDSYDAATGTGINHIESKDVVALMDHLTVRDGHRNARDTEILVTLVRSAAEMRDSFDEMKKFIEMQSQASNKRTNQNVQSAISKMMNDARSLPTSTRNVRSVSGTSDGDEAPAKKQNIFKRALKGLGSRNEKDLSRMENMLTQLLDEVEALRGVHADAGITPPSISQSRGLDSYERLRAAPDSGYEPEGQAGTSTTGASGTPSSQSRGQRMHSGYTYNRESSNRISTVMEGDEEDIGEGYENNDGMLTPTQENQRGLGVDYNTPPSAGKQFQSSQLTPTTPKTGERRSRQQSTSSSMFGGIPKISRWSKTTTSSAAEGRPSFQKDRPYSDASRSGSEVNVLPGEQGPYEPGEDDRLRTPSSLVRDREYDPISFGQNDAPFVRDEDPAEDPKYRANRHSLTLEHPQPRQGSAHQHPPHLENQAQTYHHANSSGTSQDSQGSSTSPQNDVFGSVPGLAKNRYSAGEASTWSSKQRDDASFIPSKEQSSHNLTPRSARGTGREDDEISYDSMEDEHYRRSHGNDGQYDPSLARRRYDDDYDSLDSDPDHDGGYDNEDDEMFPRPIPLERPRSPYSPGGLLEPIEERYSLEQSRISSPMSRRDTLNSKKTSRIDEEVDEDTPGTPDLSPRPAVSGQHTPDSRRKITGPREMPHARSVSGGIARKPLAGN